MYFYFFCYLAAVDAPLQVPAAERVLQRRAVLVLVLQHAATRGVGEEADARRPHGARLRRVVERLVAEAGDERLAGAGGAVQGWKGEAVTRKCSRLTRKLAVESKTRNSSDSPLGRKLSPQLTQLTTRLKTLATHISS